MPAKRQGFPEENEIVICTVTKIHFHSVFVRLDEYGKSGMIHISEISPGRIRNLRDYVKEGKVIVCKVLNINEERGHIDLSLRRVNENQRREKINAMKQEQKAEKIVELAAKQHNKDPQEVYNKAVSKIKDDYDSLHSFFEDVVEEKAKMSRLGVDKKILESITELVKMRIKPPEVVVEGNFDVINYQPDGVEVVKKAFSKFKENIRYYGAGKYHIELKDSNYKDAEKKLKQVVDQVCKELEKGKSQVSFERIEAKR